MDENNKNNKDDTTFRLPIPLIILAVILMFFVLTYFISHDFSLDLTATLELGVAAFILFGNRFSSLLKGKESRREINFVSQASLNRICSAVDDLCERLEKSIDESRQDRKLLLNRIVIDNPRLGRLFQDMDGLTENQIKKAFFILSFVDTQVPKNEMPTHEAIKLLPDTNPYKRKLEKLLESDTAQILRDRGLL